MKLMFYGKRFSLWENGNILDGIGKLPIGKVTPIGKLAFNYLVAFANFKWWCSLEVY
jgi:hypothetical protein